MDFNFDDITSKSKQALKPIQPTKSKPNGIILTIPVKDGFISRDISECTTDEFLIWARAVYPLINEEKLNPSDFNKVDQRIRALKQIEQFHMQALFTGKQNENLVH